MAFAIIYSVLLLLLLYVVEQIRRPGTGDARRISAWCAIAFTALSSLAGIWALIIIADLQKRSAFDMDYERRCFDLAFLGLLAALFWLVRARNRPALLTLLASTWSVLFWLGALATL